MNEQIAARNNVHAFGRGTQPMLFAHGFGCDQNMWRFVAPAFQDEYRIVLFDYVGSGGSELSAYDPKRYSSLDGYAQDVLDVCHALELRDVIFVGHSVSGMIGVLAANREPELFDRLIMVGPSPRYINDPPDYIGGFERADIEGLLETMDKNYIGWANFLAPAIMKNADRPELSAELGASFCSTDPVIARRFAEATFFADNRADVAALRRPSLIMQCSEDIIAPNVVGEYLHRVTPDSTLAKLAATGHCPHMSHPDETIRVIRNYLGLSVAWFKPWGWIYRPTSAAGVIAVVLATMFCAQVFIAVDRHSHSVSDTMYGVFPYIVPCLMLLNWLASKTSRQPH